MSAWITKEWSDAAGKLRREKVDIGTRGVKETDRFVVEWIDPTGKRCREKISDSGKVSKRLADDRCKQLNSQLTLGQYESKDRSNWADVKARFIRDVLPTKRSDRTRDEIEATLERFEGAVNPGQMKLITTATLDEFKAKRLAEKTWGGERNVSAATVNKDLRNLKAFFRKVAKWKMIADIPEIEMLEEIEQEKPVYTEKEFVAMYDACEAATLPHDIGTCSRGLWWRTLLVMFWETGMRRGELLDLEWSEVNLERRSIIIDPEKSKSKRLKQFHFGDLGQQHLRLLAEHRQDDYVFPWPHDVSKLNKTLGDIQETGKIDPERRNLKFHAFRRTVGEMTAERYGLTAAQYKLGHSSASLTAKFYAKAAMRSLAEKSTMPAPAGLRVVG